MCVFFIRTTLFPGVDFSYNAQYSSQFLPILFCLTAGGRGIHRVLPGQKKPKVVGVDYKSKVRKRWSLLGKLNKYDNHIVINAALAQPQRMIYLHITEQSGKYVIENWIISE